MQRLCLIIATLFFSLASKAGDGDYAVSKIAPGLLKNAHAVLRLEELRLEINSVKENVFVNHYVITILDENGDDFANFSDYYDKHRDILSIEGYLYDMNGKQLKKVKKKDIVDLSNVSSGSLIEDGRIKAHNFYYKSYPYTIEYTVEVKNSACLGFRPWCPQVSENIAVEKSGITISCPLDYKFRYKAFNYDKEPAIVDSKNTRTYSWSRENMPAVIEESVSPRWHELTTFVLFAPSLVQMDDYKGSIETWEAFGKFIQSLKVGRDVLPDNIKQAVHRIADNEANPEEKVRKLYEFMQQNTRYISIQLGIGGHQPFDATSVATKGYGDCKALSNYMYSLLKEAGIKSYYAMIKSGDGENYLTDNFPSFQFDHIILCVTLPKDTMWLECTSQTESAGYLGSFTSDRYALLVDEEGGRLIRTPKYSLDENLQARHIVASLSEDGTLLINAATKYRGMQQDELQSLITSASNDEIKKYLHRNLDFATYDVLKFNYKEQKAIHPSVDESLDLTVSNYATITGKRLFITPNIMNRSASKFSRDSTRKFDIELGYDYRDTDSCEIKLPEGYTPEAMPADVSIESKFGKYTCSTKLKDNHLYYYRVYEHNSGRFPAKDYSELVKFSEAVFKADRNRVVLVKK